MSVVVLAAGGDPGRLHATLTSIRNQSSPGIEIVVVAYDGGLVAARDAAGGDTRARFFTAGTVAAARVIGVRRSSGAFVLIAAAGDAYRAGVLADLVPVLVAEETLLLSTAREDDEIVDLRSRPAIAREPYLGRLILPRSRLAAVAVSDPDPAGRVAALGVLREGANATPFPAYRDARRTGPGPFAPRINPLPGLAAQVLHDRAALASVADLDPVHRQCALGALVGLRPYLEAVELADAEQWGLLSGHARTLRDLAADQLDELEVVPRAFALLAAEGRRDDLIDLVASRRVAAGVPTEVLEGRVVADLGVNLSAAQLVVGEDESALVAQVRRLLVDDGVLHLEVIAGIRLVDQRTAPTVTAQLIGPGGTIPVIVRSGTDAAVTRWMADPEQSHDGGLLTLQVPVSSLIPGAWEIELDWSDTDLRRTGLVASVAANGSAARVPFALGSTLGSTLGPDLTARLTARLGRVALVVAAGELAPPVATLSRIEIDGDLLRLTVDRSLTAVRLEGQGHAVDAVAGTPGFWTIALEADTWGLGSAPLPTGRYRIVLERDGVRVSASAAPGLVDRLPVEYASRRHRIELDRVRLPGADGVGVHLEPLLTDTELGPRAQRLLQREFSGVTDRLDDRLVYFQSFTGQWANDNPLAIQAELVRRRPDLDVRWVVADSSASVPYGASPLLFRSRDWYDVMTRASYLVTNIELERWYSRRPGQQVLQTFHGYPSKAMGLGLWRPRGMAPRQIQDQLEHTSRVWNALVTPTAEMDQYYRRDYDYDGRILSVGYPRNDALVGDVLRDLRDLTRQRLGIGPGQRAILYAPTWRDDLATGFRSAEAVHHLDVAEAAAALGEDHVLLMRGHRFHAPTGRARSRVLDVTGHPDINHLIAASDAAVLDYSSLRFDFAITGKPMVFLVPDLETYGSHTRGFLWDYRETAPGPLVSTTAEVVTMLRDLDALRADWGTELAAFNERYNGLHDGRAAQRVVAEFFAPLLG